jgi:hypothetical protein
MPKTTAVGGTKKTSTRRQPKAAQKTGKIAVEKASASAIRESLGVTRSEAQVGTKAIRMVRASALTKGAASKTVKRKKPTPSRPTATR